MVDLEALADRLLEQRTSKSWLADTTLASELDSHSQVFGVHERMIETSGSSALGECVGWKIGACTEQMWSGFGMVEPLRAPIFASTLQADPATASTTDAGIMHVLEAEFAFKLKSPLVGTWAAPVTAEAAWDATEEVYLAIEICVCPAHPAPETPTPGMQAAQPAGYRDCLRQADLATCRTLSPRRRPTSASRTVA